MTISIAVLIVFWLYRGKAFELPGLSKTWVLASFGLKCLLGFVLLWLYADYLDIDRASADVFKYFDDAVVLQSSAVESFSTYIELMTDQHTANTQPYYQAMNNWDLAQGLLPFNDNRTMIRLHSVLLFASQGQIWVHQLLMSLLSFLGMIWLYRGFSSWVSMPAWSFIPLLILPPSLLLWASGMLKEGLVFLPLGLSVWGLASMKKSRYAWPRLGLGLLMFLFIKPYVGLCLVPAMLFLWLSSPGRFKAGPSFAFAIGLTILLLFVLSGLGYDAIEVLSAAQDQFRALAIKEGANSAIETAVYHDFTSFIAQVPMALVNTLSRPWPSDIHGPLEALSALENIGYGILLIATVIYRRTLIHSRPLLFSLLFILSLAILVGSVSTILGATVRYKAPLLPFLMFAIFLLGRFGTLKPKHD